MFKSSFQIVREMLCLGVRLKQHDPIRHGSCANSRYAQVYMAI